MRYVAVMDLYAVTGTRWWVASKADVWWGSVGVSVLTNSLYVPVALALYVALRGRNRFAMWIGVVFAGLFIVLELAMIGHATLR